jgi:quinohemoprotein ethanol dehydrogenase
MTVGPVARGGLLCAVLLALSVAPTFAKDSPSAAKLSDTNAGDDWAGYGRTFGEQHYSPLTEINDTNVGQLSLAWSLDVGIQSSATTPLAVDGTLYVVTGHGIVRAVDAVTGKELWKYDAKAPEASGETLRGGWGVRGLGYWNGKIYLGAFDGRLIALEAKTGKPVWTANTTTPGDGRYITGAPRLFNGKVIIGHAGADFRPVRGYVTAYDAETGKQLWRFYAVPGNPAVDKDETTRIAAKTWSGEWWKFGGGGTPWNAMTYDAEADTILIGTGNGDPWNHRIRSQGKGDNLFLCSVIALNATTGAYKWHYQYNPAETWDYNAVMDIALADIKIDGVDRKVMMSAPKNGFLYVIDRTNGKLISAIPSAKITWATGVDLKTGRPIETPEARYPNGKSFALWPGSSGSHSVHAMSFSPKTGLVYLPTYNIPVTYSAKGVDEAGWKPPRTFVMDGGASIEVGDPVSKADPEYGKSYLTAWNPATQKEAWKIPLATMVNGGTMATAGNLVFQGRSDGTFVAYAADSGKKVWSFDAASPVDANPITYSVGGKQYVTVLTGPNGSSGMINQLVEPSITRAVYGQTPHRVLTFVLGGKATLAKIAPAKVEPLPDPDFKPDQASAARGAALYGSTCVICHGPGVISGGLAPDLRASPIPRSSEAFGGVLHDGILVPNGMPKYDEFSDKDRDDIRQYIRTEGDKLSKSYRAGQTQ